MYNPISIKSHLLASHSLQQLCFGSTGSFKGLLFYFGVFLRAAHHLASIISLHGHGHGHDHQPQPTLISSRASQIASGTA
jgi:hypothetical protein